MGARMNIFTVGRPPRLTRRPRFPNYEELPNYCGKTIAVKS